MLTIAVAVEPRRDAAEAGADDARLVILAHGSNMKTVNRTDSRIWNSITVPMKTNSPCNSQMQFHQRHGQEHAQADVRDERDAEPPNLQVSISP